MDNSHQKLGISCLQSSISVPQVTIVVVPKERFSYTRPALESIYENTRIPFSLVYVDGNSPGKVQRYLQAQAEEKGFRLVRSERYLAPNQARNIGLSYVKTKYLVFVDNDVVFTPGWLERLVNCAEETEAKVVCPLTCIGEPLHQTVHLAGGEAHIFVEAQGEQTVKKVHEKHYFVNRPVAEVRELLHRRQCEFAKFHCMLVRRDIFARIGLLDEALLSIREHIDFCLNVTQAGGTIYCEPDSVVTYVPGKIEWSDLPFFFLRWSDEWELSSLQHFCEKWNLTSNDRYFKKRYQRLGDRRDRALLRPFVRDLSFGQTNIWLENRLKPLERSLKNLMGAN
ncbi:MAG: glycosyltransferase [Xenococcaceae cyanobacterium MO_188.B32]|nr:glycosyltransferase [Xenococcaceae cyanobacterium MO_188.B32]